MIKRLISFMILFLYPFWAYADLKKVLSIGSDDINYRFFMVAAAVLDEQNNVYIFDSKGSFLRKYDSQGKFIKEIGKYGQGPGEFSNAISGLYLIDDLFVLDAGNNRISVLDRDLNIKKYIKIDRRPLSIMKLGDLFYMVSRKAGEPYPEIGIFDAEGNLLRSFFDQRPAFLNKMEQSKFGYALSLIYSTIATTINRETGEIAITFQWPDKNIEIFIFTKEGKFIKKTVAEHIINYNFPEFRLKGLPQVLTYPDRSNLIMVRTIHYLTQDKLLLEYWVSSYQSDKAVEEKEYILVVDKNSGRLVHKEILPIKIGIADVRGNHICAVSNEGELPEVIIYNFIY
jgi:hypothetical protein